jgi:hypothetical protein
MNTWTKRGTALIAAFCATALGGFLLVRATQHGDAQSALPTAEEYAAVQAGRTTSEQARAIADGNVTFQEFEAAIQRTAECASQAGVAIEIQPAVGKQPSSIGFRSGTLADAEAARTKLDECKAQYLREVETTWALQHAAPSSEEMTTAHRRLTECMTGLGAVVGDGFFSVDDLNTLMLKNEKRTSQERFTFDVYRRCRNVVAQEVGYVLP